MKNNPTPRRGNRNVFCPYYSSCLDMVIREDWANWNCSRCEQRENRDAEPDILLNVNYSIAYYELSRKV